ncbi:amino acid adenylation domain-containing protein, partial [Acidobacteriota bacterium]
EECGVEQLLTTRGVYEGIEKFRNLQVDVIFIEEGLREEKAGIGKSDEIKKFRSNDLAYVIFTSGSTGKPKGVPITHANFCALMHWGYAVMELDSDDRVVQNLSYYFDWSVWEIFIALTSGATLYMVPEDVMLNPENYIDFMNSNGITTLHITPTQFQILTHPGRKLKSMKHLAIGAEKLTLDLVQRAFNLVNENCRVYNMYGPTEATIMAAVLEIDMEKEGFYKKLSSIPIGPPIANSDFFILDKDMNPVPLFAGGELYICGDGIAKGYLNNPEQTAEKYIENPYHEFPSLGGVPVGRGGLDNLQLSTNDLSTPELSTYKLLYKTGDLACWLPDGTVEFLGRIDQQVKIRGFRIEPGEIENRLLQHEAVKEAFVMVRQHENRDNYLCAYIVAQDTPHAETDLVFNHYEGISETSCRGIFHKKEWEIRMDAPRQPLPVHQTLRTDLRHYLSQSLPGYMIPSYFVDLEKMPLNPNGKIDIKSLPEPGTADKGREFIAPTDEVEEKLVEIWCEVLGLEAEKDSVPQVGIDDNFFESGGHSLKAAGFLALIHKEFDVEIPLSTLFKNPTIRKISGYMKQADKSKHSSLQPAQEKKYYPLSPAQKRLYILQQMGNESVAYNMTGVLLVEGEIDKKKLEQAFIKLVERHESLRTSFYEVDEEAAQKVYIPDEIDFKIEFYKNHPLQTADNETVLPDSFQKDGRRRQEYAEGWADRFVRPFDLTTAPLLRVGLTERGKKNYILVVDMHHIISDGSSMGILIKEFISVLKGEDLFPPDFQYKDYSVWLLANREKETLKKQESFWLKEFAEEIPALNLPADFLRPVIQSFAGNQIDFEINEENTAALRTLALQENVTSYIVLLAAFNIFLSKISGQEDIVIGTVTAGRGHADLESTIGMFANTLPLRNYPAGEKTIAEFIREVKDRTLKAQENQEYQFEDLVDKLIVKRDASHNPLFDVMLVLQNVDISQVEVAGLKLRPHDYNSRMSKFDMTFICVELERSLNFTIEYSIKLFKKETIKRFANYYKTIISFVVNEPGIKISEIIILPEEDRKRILDGFNHGAEAYPD